MDVVLRPVEPRDLGIVFRHGTMGRVASEDERGAGEAWLQQALVDERYLGVLAEADSVIVGGVGAKILNWGPTHADPNPLRARITNVFVEPAFRRQGLARRLMHSLIAKLDERGISTLSLATTDEGLGLYASLGFQEAPKERVRFGRPPMKS